MSFITSYHSISDSNNSSSVNLGVNQNFIGVPTYFVGYKNLALSIFSDVGNSAANGIKIQSSDLKTSNTYTSSSTITGLPVNNSITLSLSDTDSIINSYIIITSGPFISQDGNILSLSGDIVTFQTMWNPVSLYYITLTSVVVTTSGTNITIIGTGLDTTYITPGTSIQLIISNITQKYLVTSIVTNTSSNIVLTAIGNSTVGSSSVIQLISPGSGFTYNTGQWINDFTDTYFNPSKYLYKIDINKKYYRIIYINDGVAQNVFSLISYVSPEDNSKNEQLENLSFDMNNRLEVVDLETLLEIKFQPFVTSIDPLLVSTYTSQSNITYSINNSIMTITGTAVMAAYFISQSKQYCIYQPGKTMIIYMTGIIGPSGNTNGTTTDIGYFDSNINGVGGNGLYFSYNPVLGISVNLLTSRNGVVTSIPQYLWNGDKVDGSGKSGINLSFSKMQYFVIKFAWLGVGIIKFGFNVMGKFICVHKITNYNSLSYPWMTSPNLPLRYRLTLATSSDSGTLIQCCATILSDGGYSQLGHIYSCSNLQNVVTLGITETPMLAITGSCTTTIGTPIGSTTNTYYHNPINLLSYNAVVPANTVTILLSIRLYPAGTPFMTAYPTGGITWTDVLSPTTTNSGSVIKYSQGGTTAGKIQASGSSGFTTSNSILLKQDYIYSRSQAISLSELSNIYSKLGSNTQNVSDIIIITGMFIASSGTTTALVGITFCELI